MKRGLAAVRGDLATRLRDARQRAGMSQESLALSAGVDRTYVSQIERGVGNPSVGVLWKLAQCLSMDVCDLLKPHP